MALSGELSRAPPVHLQARPEIGVVVVGGRRRYRARRRARRRAAYPARLRAAARSGWTRGQPVGQHAARRAAAHDDGVEALESCRLLMVPENVHGELTCQRTGQGRRRWRLPPARCAIDRATTSRHTRESAMVLRRTLIAAAFTAADVAPVGSQAQYPDRQITMVLVSRPAAALTSRHASSTRRSARRSASQPSSRTAAAPAATSRPPWWPACPPTAIPCSSAPAPSWSSEPLRVGDLRPPQGLLPLMVIGASPTCLWCRRSHRYRIDEEFFEKAKAADGSNTKV